MLLVYYIFVIIVLIQVGYYLGIFTQFSFAKKQTRVKQEFPVSVIVSCKNEAANLKNNLPFLVKQKYPNFEIVLIDDASTDATFQVMQSFANQHANISLLRIPITEKYLGNKKNALTKAIAIAQYEQLLFTDADCIPNSLYWIQEMADSFTKNKKIVLGYGAYVKTKGWINKLIRYETVLTAWQYFSYAKIGLAYMGVGRNIAYTKTLFNETKGFVKHQDIRSGDDDLFVNQAATKSNLAICYSKESHTLSVPKTTLTSWLHQKRRHITTATVYKPIHQLLLGLFFVSQFLFYLLFLVLLISGFNIKVVLLLGVIRFLVYYVSLIPTLRKLNEKDLVYWAVFLELFLIIFQISIFVTNLWQKPKEW